MPGRAELDRAYGDWYRPRAGRFGGPGDAVLRRLRGRLARRLDRLSPPGAILDVGAGDGALIDALGARGREAIGIDRHPSHPSVQELKIGEIDGTFAGVVFWHSLEHLPRAGAALERAASMLKPDGLIVIAIPNPASVQAGVFGDSWFALDPPRHLVHVPASLLLARLERLSMEVERVSYLRGGQGAFGWLQGMVGRLPGRPDLYEAIRRPEARRHPLSGAARAGALVAGAALLPLAAGAAAAEAAIRRGGSVYVEARRV